MLRTKYPQNTFLSQMNITIDQNKRVIPLKGLKNNRNIRTLYNSPMQTPLKSKRNSTFQKS